MNNFKFWINQGWVFSEEVLSLSATAIKQARSCQYAVFLKMKGEFKPKKSPALIVGSIFHACCEFYLRHFVQTGVRLDYKAIIACFEQEWQKGIKDIEIPEKSKAKALGYVESYFKGALPMLFPLNLASIEKFFCVPVNFGDKKLKFSGKCDLVSKDLYCIDHKSTSNFSSWNQEVAENEIQPYLYSFLLQRSGIGHGSATAKRGHKVDAQRHRISINDFINIETHPRIDRA